MDRTKHRVNQLRVAVRRYSPLLSAILLLALTLLLYRQVFSFALFFDDPFDLTRVETQSYWSLIASSEGYQYYRPVPALVWKVLHDVFGYYHLPILHLIPLLAHAITGWFLYLLLYRLGIGNWAILPAILFVTNPFHYQVVPIIGPTAHVFAGMFMLGSLNLYLLARRSSSRSRRVGFHLLATISTCLALWSHESGVIAFILLAGLEAFIFIQNRANSARPSFWPGAHGAATAFYLLVWATIDKVPSGEQTNLAEMRLKALFFLQGFTYPLSAQLVWLEDHTGIGIGVLQAGIVAVAGVLAAFIVAAYRTERRQLMVTPAAGIAIALVASLPSMARLSWGYIENGPRLLYLVAIGSAIAWGLLPSLEFGNSRLTIGWRVVTVLLLCGVVVQSWRFIDVRLDMFTHGTHIINQIVTNGERHHDRRLLVANAPSWFAQNRYEYRLGHYGVQLMPNYIGLDRVIYANSPLAPQVDAHSATWQAEVSGGTYTFGPHGIDANPELLDEMLREGRQLVTVSPRGDMYVTRDVGWLQPDAARIHSGNLGRIGAGIWLDPASVTLTEAHSGIITVHIDWHVDIPPQEDLNAIIVLLDTEGNIIERYEGYPLNGMSATRLWQTGDQINDSVVFDHPEPGTYTVWAGLQNQYTGVEIPAFDTAGTQLSEALLRVATILVTDTAIELR